MLEGQIGGIFSCVDIVHADICSPHDGSDDFMGFYGPTILADGLKRPLAAENFAKKTIIYFEWTKIFFKCNFSESQNF